MSTVGKVIAGRYRLESQLGRGGMGAVWRAQHISLGTPVAVKLMDASIAHDEAAVARFKREAQAAAAIRSPHVVQVQDFGVDDGQPYLVMEMLEGESLGSRLARKGRLSPEETSRIVTETARALAKAHAQNVVHRDIKPENIFLVRVDDLEVTKLLDFGIAKDTAPPAGAAPLTRTGVLIGTPRYMSPEQIEGRALDARSDLWSLAVVAFECLTGRPAFEGNTIGEIALAVCARPLPVPSQVAPVPHGVDAWFARAAAREVAARYATSREFAEGFAAALGLAARDRGDVTPAPGALHGHTHAGDAATIAAPKSSESTRRWTSGEARAGFEVFADIGTRTLRLRFWGMWDLALAEQFRNAVLAAYRELEPLRPWVAFSDSTGYPPQKPDVQAMHKAVMGRAGAHGLAKAAIVVNSALSQMQIRRLFEEAGNPNVQFFADPAAARAFIGR